MHSDNVPPAKKKKFTQSSLSLCFKNAVSSSTGFSATPVEPLELLSSTSATAFSIASPSPCVSAAATVSDDTPTTPETTSQAIPTTTDITTTTTKTTTTTMTNSFHSSISSNASYTGYTSFTSKPSSLFGFPSGSGNTRKPNDISAMPSDLPSQPKLKHYPQTLLGQGKNAKLRSFSQVWYKFTWLEYSIQVDAIFCQPCCHFGKSSAEQTFVNGFRNWKKVSEKCLNHESGAAHKMASDMLKMFRLNAKSGKGPVIDQLDPMNCNAEYIEKNREVLKAVLDLILFCATQDIALRGHRECDAASNRGNFIQLLHLIFKYNPEVCTKFESLPNNAKMTSPDIQNQLLEVSANYLLKEIQKDVVSAAMFAILADECKDISKREIIAVSLRYFVNGIVQEKAVGFVETADMSSSHIAEKIINVVSFFQLDPANCVGFSFDGASVMAGHKNGVQAILKRIYPNAVYTHCHSHRLNLVLGAACNSDTHFKNMFDIINQLATFFSGSKRHNKLLHMQREMRPEDQPRELLHSCDTRWSSKSSSVDKVLILFHVILRTLETFQEDRDAETRIQAFGIRAHMATREFLFLLVAFNRVFEVTNPVTVGLQKVSITCDTVLALIQVTIQTLKEFRENDSVGFTKTMEFCDELCTKYDIHEMTFRPQRKKISMTHLHDSAIMETCGHRDVLGVSAFRRLWNALLDTMLGEMESRFGAEQNVVMTAAEACRPNSQQFMDIQRLVPICKLANIETELDDASVVIFKRFILSKQSDDKSWQCAADIFPLIDQDIFPSIHKLFRYVITVPSTSCTVERMFSTMNRIKTKSRNSMLTSRLSNLSLLSFETELVRNFDLDAIITLFKSKPRRLLL